MLAAGVNPLKDLRAAKLASDIHRADGVQARVGKLKGFANPAQHEVLDRLLERAATKRGANAEELAALKAGEIQSTTCRIHVKKEIHPGVRVRIGTGEIPIQDERRNATFYYDSESGQVVQVTKA